MPCGNEQTYDRGSDMACHPGMPAAEKSTSVAIRMAPAASIERKKIPTPAAPFLAKGTDPTPPTQTGNTMVASRLRKPRPEENPRLAEHPPKANAPTKIAAFK